MSGTHLNCAVLQGRHTRRDSLGAPRLGAPKLDLTCPDLALFSNMHSNKAKQGHTSLYQGGP